MPRRRPEPAPLDLAVLCESWMIALRSAHASPDTIRSYRRAVDAYLLWCAEQKRPALIDRGAVQAFTADLLDAGAAPATARSRQYSLRRFSAWLLSEGETDADPLIGISAVKLDEKITPRLSEDQIRALLKTCSGNDFLARRDEAIVRVMLECLVRASELTRIALTDLDMTRMLITVRRGKGGKGRIVPFGPHTARALDRYLRMRNRHRQTASTSLWLGITAPSLSYQGLYKALQRRARDAGIADFHPHLTRHTGAQRWLAASGSEGGLMAVAGWRDRAMVDRYTRATASERAAEEARRLNLGDYD